MVVIFLERCVDRWRDDPGFCTPQLEGGQAGLRADDLQVFRIGSQPA